MTVAQRSRFRIDFSPVAMRRAVLLAIAVGALLRVYQLGTDSLWIDEISSIPFSRPGGLWESTRDRGPLDPIFSFLVTGAAFHLPLPVEWATRLPMAVFGTVEILAVYLLAKRLFDQKTGVVAAWLLAVAPFAVGASQGVRYYTMFSALHLLGWWLLVGALEGKSRWWIAYGATTGIALLTTPFGWPVWLVQIGTAAVVIWRGPVEGRRQRFAAMARAVAVTMFIIAPWNIYGAIDWFRTNDAVSDLAINEPFQYRVEPTVGFFREMSAWILGNEKRVSFLSATLGLLLLMSPLVASGRSRSRTVAIGVYVLGLTVGIAIAARVVGDYFAYRRIEFLLPPLMIAAAAGIVGLWTRSSASLFSRMATLSLVAVVTVASLAAVADQYGREHTNFRGMAESIAAADDATLVVIGPFDASWGPMIIQYLAWNNVSRPVVLFEDLVEPEFPIDIVWFTGNPPLEGDFRVDPLNDRARLHVVAGDASWRDRVIPLYEVTSTATSSEDFREQVAVIESLDYFLDPAPSEKPRW